MKFFKPEDFIIFGPKNAEGIQFIDTVSASATANAKLEREGKIVYGLIDGPAPRFLGSHTKQGADNYWSTSVTHKALVINIEPIEACKHPNNKVKLLIPTKGEPQFAPYFFCECGATVKPKEFEEVYRIGDITSISLGGRK